MQHLRLSQKLILLGLILLIPFAVVTYQLIQSVNDLGIRVAERQLQGTHLATPLRSLMRGVQMHRGSTYAIKLGDPSQKQALENAKGFLNESLGQIDATISGMADPFPSTKTWAQLKSDVALLSASREDLPVEESYALHTALINRVILLIDGVADDSSLILESDLVSYNLMYVMMFKGLNVTELMGNARYAGTYLIARKDTALESRKELLRLHGRIEFEMARLSSSLKKAMALDPMLRPQLEESIAIADANVQKAMTAIADLESTQTSESSSEFYYTALTAALDSVYQLQDKVSPVLDGVLETRIAKLQNDVRMTLLKALLGLIIVFGIGWFIIRNITRPLNQVVGIADKISQGNLSVELPDETRRDEIGALLQSFRRMIESLRQMAGAAGEMAGGNLATVIKPQSDKDLMGNALQLMTSNLSGLISQVQRSGIQVTSSATEIAATAKEQQATANEIAATTTEIGATSNEISATSKELVRTMKEVAEVADVTATLAENGQTGLARMTSSMQNIEQASGTINAKLTILSEKAGSINSVVTTITKVADQTNLLSLNAAIEAEKAGDYGRGFAVVATEIRRLADQTAVATFDIERIVHEMQSAVSSGVMGMDKFSEEVRQGVRVVAEVSDQLAQIIGQVQNLIPRFEQVTGGMQSQSESAQQISQALGQLSEGVQQTVESLRQSHSAIEQLNEAVRGLQQGVARFTIKD